jgi:YD repeat-containing protein
MDRNGVSTTNQFDVLDRLLERRLGGLDGVFSGREVFQYGVRGLTNYFDALTNATRFVRDELGRVTAI